MPLIFLLALEHYFLLAFRMSVNILICILQLNELQKPSFVASWVIDLHDAHFIDFYFFFLNPAAIVFM